jgi:hypothetical protein
MRASENNIVPPLRNVMAQIRPSPPVLGGTVQGSNSVDRSLGPLADEHFAGGVDHWRTWSGMGARWR